MARERFTVNPNGDKGWTVKKGGAVIANTATQEDGIDRAVTAAKKVENGGGKAQVLIKNREGKVRDERTYGDDPNPPKG
ncbi:DUF2188 domain-containing protein [Methylobacterium sp. R2-1]|uniref:DUF2188 domain-containing protein n=1 Tax=Methylobacterium sp. R2-1 TaxID=2587064 RepID=UPI0016165432|nr:DUF2188 domain-containing protein [Methylobacterium sp. R2-1]MBB2961870.1 hypothetical protein [Methylobacterium sp. R2-1]